MERSSSLADPLDKITDPRTGKITYPLVNILFMTICAVTAGANDFVAIAHFANTKKDWFAKFLDMSSGVPWHDRFNSILKHINPEEFECCILSWLTKLHEVTDGQVIAIDGKTLRRSYDRKDDKAAIHMVSAWATGNHISPGQTVVDSKSNEISAIPKLPEMIEISGVLVTIDAMGCQTEIAEQIITAKADYCLAAKGHQPTPHKALQAFFLKHLENDFTDVEVRRIESDEKAMAGKTIGHFLYVKFLKACLVRLVGVDSKLSG